MFLSLLEIYTPIVWKNIEKFQFAVKQGIFRKNNMSLIEAGQSTAEYILLTFAPICVFVEECPYECLYRFEDPKVPSFSLPGENQGAGF